MITVAEYDIMAENLPAEFGNTRIALITDIHHGSRFSYNLLNRVVGMTNKLSPDLILLGGDYVREHPPGPLAECFAKLSELDAPMGVYAVLGNHDYWNLPLMQKLINNSKIELLQNNTIWLEKRNERILLVGIKDFWHNQSVSVEMRQKLAESDFTVLLSHNPDYYDVLSSEDRANIDLMLSGHTHGGQITVFGFYAPVKMTKAEYTTGHIKPKGTRANIIVSNGIGTGGLPIRFCARPQIVIVTLKKTPAGLHGR